MKIEQLLPRVDHSNAKKRKLAFFLLEKLRNAGRADSNMSVQSTSVKSNIYKGNFLH